MTRSQLYGSRPAIIGVTLAGLFINVHQADAQGPLKPLDAVVVNTPAQPVPVFAPAPLPVSIVTNRTSFTIPPRNATQAVQGGVTTVDPSGTQYAISWVTVTNPTPSLQTVTFIAVAAETDTTQGCLLPFNAVQTAPGPVVVVPPNNTVTLSYPEPFLTTAVQGPGVCLAAGSDPATVGVKWSVGGYKILP